MYCDIPLFHLCKYFVQSIYIYIYTYIHCILMLYILANLACMHIYISSDIFVFVLL